MPTATCCSSDANTVVALDKDELASATEKGKPLFRSHFVTCPNAKQHRRREKR